MGQASVQEVAHEREGAPGPKRSLILAGGGLKVAFQAGVLQVWLDEAGIEFTHADGASGGLLNLAMWVQGMNGRQIADRWRSYSPLKTIGINWPEVWKLYWARSFMTFERLAASLRDDWGFDYARIRASTRDASFNLYNFSRHRLEVAEPATITEPHLLSGIALPTWFPPVEINGDLYIDAVYATDANVEEALRRGAEEVWIIWTVSMLGRWRSGWIRHYFQIIEAAANSRLRLVLERIEHSNGLIAEGKSGEFGRMVKVRMLQAEVPLNYLFNFRSVQFRKAVDLGVQTARQWCRENGVALQTG